MRNPASSPGAVAGSGSRTGGGDASLRADDASTVVGPAETLAGDRAGTVTGVEGEGTEGDDAAPVAGDSKALPHSLQNRAVGRLVAPHALQILGFGARLAPQPSQKRAPSELSTPQSLQIMSPPERIPAFPSVAEHYGLRSLPRIKLLSPRTG